MNTETSSALKASDRDDKNHVSKKSRWFLDQQVNKVAPITKSGELNHDKNQQLNRWTEYYSELYSEKHHLDETV